VKRRARRATIGAAVLVGVLFAVLAIANWGILRDHSAGWLLLLTETTTEISPRMPRPLDAPVCSAWKDVGGVASIRGGKPVLVRDVLESLATHADCPVISTPKCPAWNALVFRSDRESDVEVLRLNGWRVTQLRLPRVIVARPPVRWVGYPGAP
jgi:hypothetical protein